jgi:hypothetical protein
MTKLKLTALVLSFALLSSLASFAQVTGVGLRITEDVTLTVGNSSNAQFATIHEALDCLADKFIPSNVTVTIWVEPGEYTYNETVNVNHGNGDRIRITGGEPANIEDVRITFTSATGFLITDAAKLGGLSGMTITHAQVRSGIGFAAYDNGFARLGPALRVQGFRHGLHILNGASVYADGIDLRSNEHGAFSRFNGSLFLFNSSVTGSTRYSFLTQWNSSHYRFNTSVSGGQMLISNGGAGN